MARESGGAGLQVLGFLGVIAGASALVSEHQRRVELERIVEAQGERIRSLETVERQLRQTVAEKEDGLVRRDAEIVKLRGERDEIARRLAAVQTDGGR